MTALFAWIDVHPTAKYSVIAGCLFFAAWLQELPA